MNGLHSGILETPDPAEAERLEHVAAAATLVLEQSLGRSPLNDRAFVLMLLIVDGIAEAVRRGEIELDDSSMLVATMAGHAAEIVHRRIELDQKEAAAEARRAASEEALP